MSKIGNRVKALRRLKGITQADLGASIGLTFSGISSIEKGVSENPQTLALIAKYFEVDEKWLITGEGTSPSGIVVTENLAIAKKDDPWKDALVSELKGQNDFLKEQITFLRELLMTKGPGSGSFLKPLSKASAARLDRNIQMGVQLGGGLSEAA